MDPKTILVVGTYDTKDDELMYISGKITEMGGHVMTMDVSVLGDPSAPTDVSKHDVAQAGGSSIQAAIDTGDENEAMQIMARGASIKASALHGAGDIDGVIILGGTMGTDLALDVCSALPLGVPKYVVSTVSFSPLIPPDRLAADIQMILWAGGLYGLNSVCKSSLSQAAGAVLGAAMAVEKPESKRPMVGMSSLGSSCLKYMKLLKPELEDRGFDVAIFHATGMGGMAMENLASQGAFACMMDFALPEFGNMLAGSVVSSGDSRLTAAGNAGVPQMVAAGAIDLLDFAGWQEFPEQYEGRPYHVHNRLIKSTTLTPEERAESGRQIAERLKGAKGRTLFLLPTQGIQEWDKEGEETHDPVGLAAFNVALRESMVDPIEFREIDAHINDQAFADTVLEIFDSWIADGTIKT